MIYCKGKASGHRKLDAFISWRHIHPMELEDTESAAWFLHARNTGSEVREADAGFMNHVQEPNYAPVCSA
jgi:hypothetical protein